MCYCCGGKARITGYVPCAARFLFRRCATSTLLLMLCVSILASHLTDLFKTWLIKRSNPNFKIRNILLEWSETSCSRTGILQPSCENKSSNKWFILASYYEWGLYYFLNFYSIHKTNVVVIAFWSANVWICALDLLWRQRSRRKWEKRFSWIKRYNIQHRHIKKHLTFVKYASNNSFSNVAVNNHLIHHSRKYHNIP